MEFALIVPLLLLVVFGIINFGILFSQQLTLNNGVREGARRAVVSDPSAPRTCDGIITSIKNQLSGLGLDPDRIQVKITQDTLNDPERDPDDGESPAYGTFPGGQSCGTTYATGSFGGAGGHIPCVGSYDTTGTQGARSLIVKARYTANIPVAFPPFPTTLTLTSKAVYRCEFTS